MKHEEPDYDVIIVGAGLSGLVTAYQIYKKEPSLNVLIVDAAECIGGQIKSSVTAEELGARWIDDTNHEHICRLCSELGIPLLRRNLAAVSPLKRRWAIDEHGYWPIPYLANFELQRFIRYIDLISKRYYPGRFVQNSI